MGRCPGAKAWPRKLLLGEGTSLPGEGRWPAGDILDLWCVAGLASELSRAGGELKGPRVVRLQRWRGGQFVHREPLASVCLEQNGQPKSVYIVCKGQRVNI